MGSYSERCLMVCGLSWHFSCSFILPRQVNNNIHTLHSCTRSFSWIERMCLLSDLRELKTFPHWPHFITGSFLPWWTFQIWIFKVSSRVYFFGQYGHSKQFTLWQASVVPKPVGSWTVASIYHTWYHSLHISHVHVLTMCLTEHTPFYKCCIGVF